MRDRCPRILLGPYRSGKTVALLKELVRHCREDVLSEGDALLIVPSKRYQRLVERRVLTLMNDEFERASDELAFDAAAWEDGDAEELDDDALSVSIMPSQGQRHGYIGLNITSFYQACSMVLRRCGVIPRVIPEAVRPALVARVLSELKAEERLEHLLPIVDFVGTHAALLDLIDELERSGLSPYEVIERLDSSASQSSRHSELALVYQRYWEALDRIGFLDNRRIAFKCREVLASRQSSVPLFGFAGVDGFDRFNHLQLQVLEELTRHTKESIVCFDYSEDACDSTRREYMWKDSSFADLKKIFGHARLDWVQADDRIVVAYPSPMKAFKTVDRFLEMEEAARLVKQSLVEKRTPAGEILVVVANLKEYKGAIESAFDDAGVPYFVDESLRMMTLPIVQFALSLLRAFENDFARADVIRILTSRFFKPSSFALSQPQINSLDTASQKEKLIGGREQWLKVADRQELICEMTKLFDCLTPPDSIAPLTTFVSWCEDVLISCLALDDDAEFRNPLQGWTDERALMETQNLFASLVQEDAILYGDKGGYKSDYRGFMKKLLHAFEKANFRAAPAAKNSVVITSVDLADNQFFDEVFIAGCVEGEFPRRLSGRGFVSADEVARWHSFGIDISNPRMHPAFEYALFRSLINRARKSVTLSYPMWDMSGEELLPSFFLTGESLPVTIEDVDPYGPACHNPVSARNYIAGKLWKRGSRVDTVSGDPEVVDLFQQIEESVAMVRARAGGALESPFNGYLADAVASSALEIKLPARFSASRLNDYGKCPFRYWVSHVMKVPAFEEATLKLEVTELGETYHLAFERFYDRLIKAGISLLYGDRQTIESHFELSVKDALEWLEKKRGANCGEFWDYEKKEIVFRLRKFLDKEIERAAKSKIDYLPQLVEAAFGMDDSNPSKSAPALRVTDGVRTVEFRGKIDRVDVAGGLNGSDRFEGLRARVIDYKAGSSNIPPREANEGRNLQLPIYALAVERCVMPGATVSQGAYLSFTSGAPIGNLKFEEDKEDERGFVDMQRVERHILNYVDGMEKGIFTVAPSAVAVCDNCDHKRVCRVSELRQGVKSNDFSD
ncbi:MAG: PD-(D/E)XK nuclease family protein [Candidatus Obscuribacterales bacterium]|nr:PD-(D/E)XK nuclease family protein [Candidatus Obscuribacterales bacterium]